jgi:hypothetical protein
LVPAGSHGCLDQIGSSAKREHGVAAARPHLGERLKAVERLRPATAGKVELGASQLGVCGRDGKAVRGSDGERFRCERPAVVIASLQPRNACEDRGRVCGGAVQADVARKRDRLVGVCSCLRDASELELASRAPGERIRQKTDRARTARQLHCAVEEGLTHVSVAEIERGSRRPERSSRIVDPGCPIEAAPEQRRGVRAVTVQEVSKPT